MRTPSVGSTQGRVPPTELPQQPRRVETQRGKQGRAKRREHRSLPGPPNNRSAQFAPRCREVVPRQVARLCCASGSDGEPGEGSNRHSRNTKKTTKCASIRGAIGPRCNNRIISPALAAKVASRGTFHHRRAGNALRLCRDLFGSRTACRAVNQMAALPASVPLPGNPLTAKRANPRRQNVGTLRAGGSQHAAGPLGVTATDVDRHATHRVAIMPEPGEEVGVSQRSRNLLPRQRHLGQIGARKIQTGSNSDKGVRRTGLLNLVHHH